MQNKFQNNTNKKKTFYYALEGLRAFSVLGVIFYHVFPKTFKGGFAGVTIFFVISGFLMTQIIINEIRKTNEINVKKFLKRRFWRLYPAFFVMIILTTTVLAFFFPDGLFQIRQTVFSNLFYVNNWYQIGNSLSYFDQAAHWSVFTHLWSLSVESQFYIFWPVLFAFLWYKTKKNIGKITLITLGLTLASALLFAILYDPSNINRTYYGTDTRLFSFLIGALVAILNIYIPQKNFTSGSIKIFQAFIQLIFTVTVLSFLTLMDGYSDWVFKWGMLALSFLSGVLVFFFVNFTHNIFSKFMGNKVFRWLGSRSYSIYLYQLPVLVLFERIVKKMNPFWSLVAIVLIFILSELSYTYIENPLRKGIQGLKIKSYKPLIVVASFSLIGTIGLFTAFSSKQADRNLFAEQLKKELVKKNAEVKRQNSIAQSNRELSSFISANQSNPLNDQQKDFIKNIGINEIQFKKGANKKITGIGDSVMLAISPDLQFIFPQAVINAQVGRHTLDVIPILQQLKEQKKLDNNILMMIGMNGEIKPEQIDQIMKIIGKKRQVYWVNNYAAGRVWIDPNNQVLKDAAKKMQNLHIIDWFDIVNKNNNLVVQDGVHPTQDGTRIITREIINQILK